MIEELRKEIDVLDDEIVQLFCRRLSLCKQIGEIKAKNGITVADFDRENAVLCRLTASLDDENAAAVKKLYAEIFNVTKSLQQKIVSESGEGNE